ncbi:MAG TPA: hypothetical protein VEY67_06105 [Candidatus Dormibacteraeota bacterium]|nr:hypothetical protein [Candidatus Dormibacteraeota bacterium]
MTVLLALFLLVHGGVHIGYVCSRSWPFEAADPWLVTGLGASAGATQTTGTILALVAFFAFLFAAGSTVGLLPRRAWRWLVGAGAIASALMLVGFATPWTLPGLAVDGGLLWAVFPQGWSLASLRRRTA